MPRSSMFEFAGGEPAFLALATAHHARCLADPVLSHPFSHPGHPQHVERLAWYWAEVFGGPARHSTSCGGQAAMLGIHAGQGAGEDLGARFVACFVQAAEDAGLPADPDFRAGLRSYMEWAVGEVLACSPAGSTVPPDQPMPRWSWNGLEQPFVRPFDRDGTAAAAGVVQRRTRPRGSPAGWSAPACSPAGPEEGT